MKKWRVFRTREDCEETSLTKDLNDLEEEGWNTISVVHEPYGMYTIGFMERKV